MSVEWKFGDYVRILAPGGLRAEGVAKRILPESNPAYGRTFDLRVGCMAFFSDEVVANLTEERRVPVGVGPQHDGRPRGQ